MQSLTCLGLQMKMLTPDAGRESPASLHPGLRVSRAALLPQAGQCGRTARGPGCWCPISGSSPPPQNTWKLTCYSTVIGPGKFVLIPRKPAPPPAHEMARTPSVVLEPSPLTQHPAHHTSSPPTGVLGLTITSVPTLNRPKPPHQPLLQFVPSEVCIHSETRAVF